MKLSLIFPSWTYVFGNMENVAKGASTFPPLNLAYLAAIAEKHGHTVQLIDGEVESLTFQDIVSRVLEFKPDIIGLTATTPIFHIMRKQAEELKRRINVPIIAGGPHITYFREKVFHECFDYLVIGECEGTFGPFLDAIEKRRIFLEYPVLYSGKTAMLFLRGKTTSA